MSQDNVSSTYAQIRPVIDRQFPAGRFVAVDNGQVVADAPTHRELADELRSRGKSPKDLLIVQAEVDYPTSAVIF